MAKRRVFCCPIKEGLTSVSGPEAHHLLHVLRLRAGETVEVFDGLGHYGDGEVVDVGKRELSISVTSVNFIGQKVARVVIAAAVAKGDRFDWLVGKCTELGVDRISPIIFDRTVKMAKGEKIVARYEKLALSAAKQCGRMWLPQIDRPCGLGEFLGKVEGELGGAKVVYGLPSEGAESLLELGELGTGVVAVIGPEGGFTEDEERLLAEHGAVAVRLTDTVLRIETAAVAFGAGLCTLRDCGGTA